MHDTITYISKRFAKESQYKSVGGGVDIEELAFKSNRCRYVK